MVITAGLDGGQPAGQSVPIAREAWDRVPPVRQPHVRRGHEAVMIAEDEASAQDGRGEDRPAD